MRIAYLVNQYPAASHSFIRREIGGLEALGETVFRFALRAGANLVDSEDKNEEKRTRYILNASAIEFIRCVALMLAMRPMPMCQAIVQAITIGWGSDRGLLRHLIYFVEAAVFACWCRQGNLEHIHAHFGTNSATIAMLAAKISGIQFSFTVHGPEEFEKAPLIALAQKIRHCAFVVAISSFGRSQLYRCVEQRYWTKVKVVHCAIEPTYSDAADNSVSDARRFICVGRLNEQKGHLILLEAMQCLVTRGADFELVLCGDGEMRDEIEAVITRYNLEEKVRLLGWVDDAQVREEILKSRALVLPSFAEGLPVVIIEAMALRRPVISTFVAGIPELVIPDENGWLVPAGDIEALAAAIRSCLAANAETLIRMGKAGQKRVLLRHDLHTEASKLSILFEASIRARSELVRE